MLFDGSPQKRRKDRFDGLPTREQLARGADHEKFLILRAQRREAEARVRHSNFALVERTVVLVLAVVIGTVLVMGALGNPALLKLAAGAATAWGGVAALTLHQGIKGKRGAQ